ncbi:helix-turn-helix domain-containing protein [Streptomyces sp. NPDC005574]|uniref:helix-turn-helix domain-containing protein n=1 Tax=Streptomyces sp. NPDC005574 TaxID=3156891 RepID=UPI0033A1BEBD
MAVTLPEAERAELVCRARMPHRRSAEKASIVLACADGMSNAGVARIVGVRAKTVGRWRRAFAAERMAGLEDAGRIGRPKVDLILDDAERRQLQQWVRQAGAAQCLALRFKRALSPFLIAATSGLLEESLADESSQAGAGDVDRGLAAGQAEVFVQIVDAEHLPGVLVERGASKQLQILAHMGSQPEPSACVEADQRIEERLPARKIIGSPQPTRYDEEFISDRSTLLRLYDRSVAYYRPRFVRGCELLTGWSVRPFCP